MRESYSTGLSEPGTSYARKDQAILRSGDVAVEVWMTAERLSVGRKNVTIRMQGRWTGAGRWMAHIGANDAHLGLPAHSSLE